MRKHSDERSESPHLAEVRRYVQTQLVPPRHVRFACHVLYDAETRTARYQVEVTDPFTKELLAMESRPFHTDCTADDALMAVTTIARRLAGELSVGDPF
jgi:hypothetical protein